MADARQPLLPGNGADVDGGGNAHESSAAAAAVEARLEAGFSAEAGAVDFETLLREDPDHVIEYLANRGTKLLGAFITEDTEVLPLLRDGTIWTLGRRILECSICGMG